MKASGGFGIWWMTVKEGCIFVDWRKSIHVMPFGFMPGKGILMPFSSCDKYKRNTKQRRRSCTMFCGLREGI